MLIVSCIVRQVSYDEQVTDPQGFLKTLRQREGGRLQEAESNLMM